ncbi:hypothetical protein [Sulfurimonas sp.]|uniref:hypothetical protein n=1 Tax=Sulfurimonas sp. TaxID=2022749 RepID=UPI002AB1D2D9|nr:hypothetical protein [Sulfurimonas sp.]
MDNGYYKFDSDILDIDFTLFIHETIEIDQYFFVAKGSYNISIFKGFYDITSSNQDVYIGGNKKENIPLEDFQKLQSQFPTSTELAKYKNFRIELIIKEYIDTKQNFEEKYIQYMNKKISKKGLNLDVYNAPKNQDNISKDLIS